MTYTYMYMYVLAPVCSEECKICTGTHTHSKSLYLFVNFCVRIHIRLSISTRVHACSTFHTQHGGLCVFCRKTCCIPIRIYILTLLHVRGDVKFSVRNYIAVRDVRVYCIKLWSRRLCAPCVFPFTISYSLDCRDFLIMIFENLYSMLRKKYESFFFFVFRIVL